MGSENWIEALHRGRGLKLPMRLEGSDGRLYEVQEQIGAGGNAVVFECADEVDGTILAAKFLAASARDEARIPRFERETRIIEALTAHRHEHLVRFIASGQAKGQRFDVNRRQWRSATFPFFVMERASQSLRDLVKQSVGAIPQEIYFAQFRGLVSALATLHDHAIHRDIKPENILVVGERWAISDFGLCEEINGAVDLTAAGHIPGPRFWMSPEANNRSVGIDEAVGFASDVFQLAAVFWWVVTRRHPSGILVREDWCGADRLFEPVSRALQHSLRRRYATAQEFATAVTSALEPARIAQTGG